MFGTIADWRAYALARGDSAPTNATDVAATAALVRASDHIQFAYVAQFLPGYDETEPEVEIATYEAAGYELATPGFFSKVYTPGDRKVLTKVDAIQWTVIDSTDSINAFDNATPTSTRIAAMLAKYMPGKTRVGIKALGS